jgi:hypothetical protein
VLVSTKRAMTLITTLIKETMLIIVIDKINNSNDTIDNDHDINDGEFNDVNGVNDGVGCGADSDHHSYGGYEEKIESKL